MKSLDDSMSQKPNVLFVFHYIGSLRYFEKLESYLGDKYHPIYFYIELQRSSKLIQSASHFNTQEIISYCREKNHDLQIAYQPDHNSFSKYSPFYQFIRIAKSYKTMVDELLSNPNLKKIISINDGGFYYSYIFTAAKKRGIDAMVLQWALTYDIRGPQKPEKFQLRKFLFKIRKTITTFLKKMALKIFVGFETVNTKTIFGGGTSEKVGVINQQALDYLASNGVPAEKMTVVGYLDFHMAQKVKNSMDADAELREKTAKKWEIDLNKKNIVIYSSAYNSNVVNVLDDAGQLALYEGIVKIIRRHCPPEKYAISLKIHPIEKVELYKPLEKYGVKVYDKFTHNHELIYFADLYIADETTTTFIPLMMRKQAIFINFMKLDLIELSKKYFGIKKYITDPKEFEDRILDFTLGKLEPQYDFDRNIFTEDSLTKILNWIG